jgi:hypothetical protein
LFSFIFRIFKKSPKWSLWSYKVLCAFSVSFNLTSLLLMLKIFYYYKLITNYQGPEPFSKFRVPRNRFWNVGTFFTNLGFQRTSSWTLFKKLGLPVPATGFGTLFSKLGFRPEPVPDTLQNLGFRNRFQSLSVRNPYQNLGFQRTGSGTRFTNLVFPETGSGTLFSKL